jgi:hypothetical protein
MPKGKIEGRTKRDRVAVARTNKIGGRKNTKGAAQLSADELRSKLKVGRGRDRQRARNELVKRGEPLVIEEPTEEAA